MNPVVRDVWIDTSQARMKVLCIGRVGTVLESLSRGEKPIADQAVVMGGPALCSTEAAWESECDVRFQDLMSELPAELLKHAFALIREGYRIV